MRKVLITGSRDWRDKLAIATVIYKEYASADGDLLVIHGDHHAGVDAMAEDICYSAGILTAKVSARWGKLGKKAVPQRNACMVGLAPDVCYAFPLQDSVGTWDTVNKCRAANVPVLIYPFTDQSPAGGE